MRKRYTRFEVVPITEALRVPMEKAAVKLRAPSKKVEPYAVAVLAKNGRDAIRSAPKSGQR